MSEIAIALNRFGLGARAGDSPPGDARAWLTGQLDRYEVRPAPIAALPSREAVVTELADYLEELRAAGAGARAGRRPGGMGRRAGMDEMPAPPLRPCRASTRLPPACPKTSAASSDAPCASIISPWSPPAPARR